MRKWTLSFLAGALVAVALLAASSQPPVLTGYLRDVVRRPSTYVDARVLAADTAETVTVPTFGAEPQARVIAVLSATCSDYFVNVTTTAAAPSADVTNGTASERNPAALQFAQADNFSLVASATCKVTIAYYLANF